MGKWICLFMAGQNQSIIIFSTQNLQQLMKEMKNKSLLSMQADTLPLICSVSDMFR